MGFVQQSLEDAEVDYFEIIGFQFSKAKSFAPIQDAGNLLILGKVSVFLNVEYTHPDWENAAYDSDNKKLIPFDSISGNADTVLNIGFSASATVGADGLPSDLEAVSIDVSSGVFVQIQPFPF